MYIRCAINEKKKNMCEFSYPHTYVYLSNAFIPIKLSSTNKYVYTYIYTHVFIRIYAYVFTRIYAYVFTRTFTYTCTVRISSYMC